MAAALDLLQKLQFAREVAGYGPLPERLTGFASLRRRAVQPLYERD